MCLSDIARVIRHDPEIHDALVDIDGRSTHVSTITLGLDSAPLVAGDWLVIHTGLAVERLSADEADLIHRAREGLQPSPPGKEQP